jgi:hypothetical protein
VGFLLGAYSADVNHAKTGKKCVFVGDWLHALTLHIQDDYFGMSRMERRASAPLSVRTHPSAKPFNVYIRIKVATRSHTNVAGHSHSELPLLPMTGVCYEADIS